MKKIIALLLVVVMSFALLTGCSDPLYDDFENYLNVQTTEVNANYEKLTAEAASWADKEDDAQFIKSLQDVLIPIVEDSLTKLASINPATEEVKAVKDKYVRALEAYKEGFFAILDGFKAQDADKINAGNENVQKGVTLIDEYNQALEELAAEVGAEIQY